MKHRVASSPHYGDLASLEQVGPTIIVTIILANLYGPEMAELMRELLDMTRTDDDRSVNLVLDMQNVTSIDSQCIGVLISTLNQMQANESGETQKSTKKRWGRRSRDAEPKKPCIALVNAGHSIQNLFRLTRLDRVFPICRDVMTALQAVEGRPGEAVVGTH